ncbi:MAG: zf-HC2 domain-containing protein [bacterium]
MKLDFSAARSGLAGCPSDRALDALHVGALPPEEQAEVQAHLATCAACRCPTLRDSARVSSICRA